MARSKRRPGSRNRSRGFSFAGFRRRLGSVSKWILLGVLLAVILLAVFIPRLLSPSRRSIGENAISTAVSPVQSFFTNATNWVVNIIQSGRNYAELNTRYSALLRENEALKLEVSSYSEQAAENERLVSLLGASEHYTAYSPVYARVIAREPGPWFGSFTIDVGTLDGITADMAVVTGDGLVGRVTTVGLNSATVVSIIDASSSVACLIQRTRDNGVLHGVTTDTSTEAACYVYYLPSSSDAAITDKVITSGVDSKYPKGLEIGVVTEVSHSGDSTDKYIVVSPSVDFKHIEEVLVLKVSYENSNNDAHARLFTATPSPTKMPSELTLHTPTPVPTENPEDDDLNWYYPTSAPSDPSDMGELEKNWAGGNN